MKKTLLTAVSTLAIATALPAFAQNGASSDMQTRMDRTQDQSDINRETITEEDVRESWEDTKDTVSDTADDISDATAETYNDLTDSMAADSGDDVDVDTTATVTVNQRTTADGMIGEPVYNTDGERVAKIHDIIMDDQGEATMVILADGDFTGLGKLVAYEYDMITNRTEKGDIITSLSEDRIDDAASFSYETDASGDNVRVIPDNGYSVAELMDSVIVNTDGDIVADVDNISFRNGTADQIIVGFGDTFGIGGEQAAMAFNQLELQRTAEGGANFRLNAQQSSTFKSYKNNM